MSEPVWTFPGPILDMLAKGLEEMADPPDYIRTVGPTLKVSKVAMMTDSGWVTIRRLEGT